MSTQLHKQPGLLRRYLTDSRYTEWRWAYIFLAVDLAWSTLFLFYPLARAMIFSLQEFTLANVGNIRFVGLANYIEILTDVTGWWHSVKVTLLYTAGTVPLQVLIPLGLALLINRLSDRSGNFFKAAFYIPTVVSSVVIAVILRWIFNPMDGLANLLLRAVGLPPLGWYGSPELSLFTLILMVWITGHGWGAILYSAALKRVPKHLYEAADIDAASGWSKFKNITWPLLKPTTLYVAIINLIGAFQGFWGAFFITKGGPLRTTEFVNWRIYTTFYTEGDFGLASAMAVILMLIIMLISMINFGFFGSDVEY